MIGNLLIAIPRQKVGIISALLYLSPLSFSQLYVVSTEDVHIIENAIVVGDIISIADSTDTVNTVSQAENNPEKTQMPLAANSQNLHKDIKSVKKEGSSAKEGKTDQSHSQSKTAFLPVLPDSQMTAAMKSTMVALPGSNYQNRAGLTTLNYGGISPVYLELQSDPEVYQSRVSYQEITIFAIRPPPTDI